MSPLQDRRRPPSLRGWAAGAFRGLALTALSTLLLAPIARAQTKTVTVATGLVVDVPLSATALGNLDFVRMQPGTAKAVAAQDAQTCTDGCRAGKWHFQNISRRGADRRANLQFAALPDSLIGPGGAKLGVSYTARACVWWRALNVQLNCVAQATSTSGSTVVVPINGAGAVLAGQPRDLYLWLGGTATPRPGQRAGDYTGVVTVFFFYN
jgi:hypothetical protein